MPRGTAKTASASRTTSAAESAASPAVPGKKVGSASGPPIDAMAKPVKRSGETGFDIVASTAHLVCRIRQTAARDRAYPVADWDSRKGVELGRRLIRWGLPLVLVAVAGAGAAMAATAHVHTSAATVKVAKSSKFGTILVGSTGRTLYRYTLDRKGVNRCSSNATCNKYWPPLLVKPAAKPTVGTGAKAALVGTIKAA